MLIAAIKGNLFQEFLSTQSKRPGLVEIINMNIKGN